jgi:hypothetical protein
MAPLPFGVEDVTVASATPRPSASVTLATIGWARGWPAGPPCPEPAVIPMATAWPGSVTGPSSPPWQAGRARAT